MAPSSPRTDPLFHESFLSDSSMLGLASAKQSQSPGAQRLEVTLDRFTSRRRSRRTRDCGVPSTTLRIRQEPPDRAARSRCSTDASRSRSCRASGQGTRRLEETRASRPANLWINSQTHGRSNSRSAGGGLSRIAFTREANYMAALMPGPPPADPRVNRDSRIKKDMGPGAATGLGVRAPGAAPGSGLSIAKPGLRTRPRGGCRGRR